MTRAERCRPVPSDHGGPVAASGGRCHANKSTHIHWDDGERACDTRVARCRRARHRARGAEPSGGHVQRDSRDQSGRYGLHRRSPPGFLPVRERWLARPRDHPQRQVLVWRVRGSGESRHGAAARAAAQSREQRCARGRLRRVEGGSALPSGHRSGNAEPSGDRADPVHPRSDPGNRDTRRPPRVPVRRLVARPTALPHRRGRCRPHGQHGQHAVPGRSNPRTPEPGLLP